jgi:hypothetical protein
MAFSDTYIPRKGDLVCLAGGYARMNRGVGRVLWRRKDTTRVRWLTGPWADHVDIVTGGVGVTRARVDQLRPATPEELACLHLDTCQAGGL